MPVEQASVGVQARLSVRKGGTREFFEFSPFAGYVIFLKMNVSRIWWFVAVFGLALLTGCTRFSSGGADALREGFVVWESSRSGAWRIFRKPLEGGEAVQVSPDEEGRDHFGAHVSPNGTRLVYLSYPRGKNGYRPHPPGVTVPLWIIDLQGGSPARILVPNARPYGEHRSVVWLSDEQLAYLDPAYHTRILDIGSGESEPFLNRRPRGGSWDHGFLPSTDLSMLTTGLPQVFQYEGKEAAPRLVADFEGCQPLFTRDNRWFYWMSHMGGPIQAMRLSDGEPFTLLAKNDPRMPEDRGYLYFPHISPDRRLLVFAASPGDHDHHRSNYDLFLLALDPETLQPVGDPVAFDAHPATDRFPEVWSPWTPPDSERISPENPTPVEAPEADAPLLVWEHVEGERWIRTSTAAEGEPLRIERKQAAAYSGHGWLNLAGGYAVIPGGGELLSGPAFTFMMGVEGASSAVSVPEQLWSTSEGNLLAGMSGRTLWVSLPGGDREILARDLPMERPFHLVWVRENSHLSAWVEGTRRGRVRLPEMRAKGDLRLGGDAKAFQSDWGTVGDLVILPGARSDEEIQERARIFRKKTEAREALPRSRVRAVQTDATPAPTLEEISPYLETMVVCEYRVLETLEGPEVPETLRVTHWALLDGKPVPLPEKGREVVLTLEPRDRHAHLQRFNRVDTLPFTMEAADYMDVGHRSPEARSP